MKDSNKEGRRAQGRLGKNSNNENDRENKGEREAQKKVVYVYILIQTHRFRFNIYVSEPTSATFQRNQREA